MKGDRRDRGHPGEKEWQEFQTSYAAARLFGLLLYELEEIAPTYGADFRHRLNWGIAVGEGYLEEDPDSDGPALIPSPTGGESDMMDLSEAYLLEKQLFPEGGHDPRDFYQAARGMVVVALHSAFEIYSSAVGATAKNGPMPKAVISFLSTRSRALAATLGDDLTEFDETRHLMVHSQGAVTDRYANSVKYNKRIVGEVRSLSARDVDRYSELIWTVAQALKAATASMPQ